MIFEKIIIIGNGTIALEITKILSAYCPIAISYKPHFLSMLEIFCKKNHIPYYHFNQNDLITKFLDNFNEKTLIISANNHYIFPREIIEKPQIKIINFHNALLPLYKGVNAPIWSIYNQDKISGITWHMVNSQLDSGEIISQSQFELTPNIKAIELIKILIQLGISSFLGFKDSLLQDDLKLTKMPPSYAPINKAKDLPNKGFLDISWNEDKISAFLRSMDAGGVIPKPKILISENEYIIESYGFAKTPFMENSLVLYKNNISMLLKSNGGGGI
ncbi:formyltransferase family protein [Helicobacter cappadocius]|uniref:Formyltransferase family protein n=1 Tax=Helicobacter cappadocius TaxID=3063998 RepID=A0ABT8Z3R9_9HELI|nr:formyltransferase family protein [Helicobacter sp. faydin-H75]MDO7253168.1 formyltransferase family protein [Helicobacter sp. faydin-H75]